uniref:Uncharacterized protein n=1 Tax=uncultured marine microorganism HF4000_010I05 TaxID=455517 RepID=B3T1L4_9ZZZZ|nr:hypothetical protein ALOHA_HF4000010I05ctg1g37 [uncultured marine microorganism HF4000_010I05]
MSPRCPRLRRTPAFVVVARWYPGQRLPRSGTWFLERLAVHLTMITASGMGALPVPLITVPPTNAVVAIPFSLVRWLDYSIVVQTSRLQAIQQSRKDSCSKPSLI